jgi:hypothetical protein
MLFEKYASRKSEAKYASLRDGLREAWCPAIQSPSGTNVYGLGTGRAKATLQNATLSTCWSRSGGVPCITTDGTDDYASLSLPVSIPFSFTISAVFYDIGAFHCVANTLDSTNFFTMLINSSGAPYFFSGGALFFPGPSLTFGVRSTITATLKEGQREMWLNGVRIGTNATQPAGSSSLTDLFRFSAATFHSRADWFAASVHNRVLSSQEILLMHKIPDAIFRARNASIGGAGGFKAAWARNRSQVIGGGLG